MHDRAVGGLHQPQKRLDCTIVQSRLASDVAQRVRRERERQGLRQDELALAAGVSPRTVFQIESGKPTSRLDVVAKVLSALGLAVQVVSAPRTLQPVRTPADSGSLWRFSLSQDAGGEYRWQLRAPNNRVVAMSACGYAKRDDALRAVHEVAVIAGTAIVEGNR